MNLIIDEEINPNETKRPVFLLVLCILSFVSIGWSLLTAIVSLFTGPASEETMIETKVEFTKQINQMNELGSEWGADIFRKLIHITEATNTAHYSFTMTTIVILIIGALGVFWMLKRKKLGFHLYIIYSLLSAVQLYFFVNAAYVPTFLVIFSAVFSGIFILLYSLNLKWMK